MPRCFVTPHGKHLTLVRRLGQGQFGVAELVRDRRNENFCLKQVPVRTADEDAKAEVMREVELMKMSAHSNVIALHDSWFDRNRLYILMEYCVNSSVDLLIAEYASRQAFFTEDKVISFVTELSSALHFLHGDLKVMHRDLKPGNVFMDRIGTLKIGDFGLSKCLGGDAYCASFVGTPLYMSPEQCKGESYSFETDVWALGCIAYEFMALASPWIRGSNTYPALVKNITSLSPDFGRLAERYSNVLINSTRWMLQKKPGDRWTAAMVNAILRPKNVDPPLDASLAAPRVTEADAAMQFAEVPRQPPDTPPAIATGTVVQQATAVAIIQRSFRRLASERYVSFQRTLSPAGGAPPAARPDVAVTKIQTGFRMSMNNRRRRPNTYRTLARNPTPPTQVCSDRITQLALPRNKLVNLPRVQPPPRPVRAAWT
jgi:serine/threonine protein kinase